MSSTDPSRTSLIRRKFVKDVNGRYRSLLTSLREVSQGSTLSSITDYTKIQERLDWFDNFIDLQFNVILLHGNWYKKYIRDAYTKGARRGILSSKKEELFWLDSASIEGLEIAYLRQVSDAFSLNLLEKKTLSDLTTITKAIKGRMLSDLAIALVREATPKEIYAEMRETIQKIGIARSGIVARTEVVRAQSYGLLDALKSFGIEEVKVQAEKVKKITSNINMEFITSTDRKVCPLCQPFDGQVMSIQQAYGLIPLHPNCRCSFIGVNSPKSKDVDSLILGVTEFPDQLNQ